MKSFFLRHLQLNFFRSALKHTSGKILLALSLLIINSLQLQAQAIEKSLLWEISGKGIQKPSYLYGTFHVMCESDFFIRENLKAAMKKADQITFEVNMSDPGHMQEIQATMQSDVPLSKKLSPAQYHAIDSLLKAKMSVPLQQFDNLKLAVISSLLSLKSLPCDQPKMYEAELMKIATEFHKPVAGLETITAQMEFLDKAFSDEFLIRQMLNFEDTSLIMQQMTDAYKEQDLEALSKMNTDARYAEPQTEKYLLEIRNNNWMLLMPEMMKKESNLFAVGAGHLAGQSGLIRQLRKMGYRLKPLY